MTWHTNRDMVAIATETDVELDFYWRSWEEPPKPSLVEWADDKRVLSRESNPNGGRWRTSTVPYAAEPMCTITDPRYEQIVLMWPTQSGKTEILMNFVGYIHEIDPGPILYAIENLDKAKVIVQDRYLPMLRDTPSLRRFRKAGRGRGKADLEDGIDSHGGLHYSFPNGHFSVVGSNSAAGFSSRPIRYLLLDEIDGWALSAGKEGDQVMLAWNRAAWFWNRKMVAISSPRDDDTSRIQPLYEASDQRQCYLPCLKCGTYQLLEWESLRWKQDTLGDVLESTVGFECRQCGRLIPQRERYPMLTECEWRATFPGRKSAGFWLWAAYCPSVLWVSLVTEYLQSKDDEEKYKVFVNTKRAQTWKRQEETTSHHQLMLRAEERQQWEVPDETIMLTAGVDVQHDRLECSIYGWGIGEQGWLIGHTQVWGKIGEVETERDLDTLLSGSWKDSTGRTLSLSKVCIDSGYKTDEVYLYARSRTNVLATKGMAKATAPAVGLPSPQDVFDKQKKLKIPEGVLLWPIGSYFLKETLEGRLQKTGPGPKTIQFPAGLAEEFYLQLLSERLETFRRGRELVKQWIKKRPRNDTWDCLILAYAAAIIAGIRTLTQRPAVPIMTEASGQRQNLVGTVQRQGLVPTGALQRLLGR